MREPQVVTTSERHDLDEQAEAAFRPGWPEFIFHDPTSSEFIGRVETYFRQYDVLLLDDGQVVAGWGVPIQWNGTVSDPWIRTHQRLGATILAPAPRSMVITGTVGEWEDWARALVIAGHPRGSSAGGGIADPERRGGCAPSPPAHRRDRPRFPAAAPAGLPACRRGCT